MVRRRDPPPLPARVTVTGAGGFIGGALVTRLLACGAVVIGVEPPRGSKESVWHSIGSAVDHPNFVPVDCDVTVPAIAETIAGVDAVVHLAAVPGVRSSWGIRFADYLNINVLGTKRVLDACLERGFDGTRQAGHDERGQRGNRPDRDPPRSGVDRVRFGGCSGACHGSERATRRHQSDAGASGTSAGIPGLSTDRHALRRLGPPVREPDRAAMSPETSSSQFRVALSAIGS